MSSYDSPITTRVEDSKKETLLHECPPGQPAHLACWCLTLNGQEKGDLGTISNETGLFLQAVIKAQSVFLPPRLSFVILCLF